MKGAKTWCALWVLAVGFARADPYLPGCVARTKPALPTSGFTLDAVKFSYGFGHLDDRSFQSGNFYAGCEINLASWASVGVGMPFYTDRVSETVFARGDLVCDMGLRWKPWGERSVYTAVFPFITVPTGDRAYSSDSLRRFTTLGLDWGVMGALSLMPERMSVLSLNIGFYNPNQARGYGSHTNQIVYRMLWTRQWTSWFWLGPEWSGEWFIVNSIVPEVSWIAGGSPMRVSLSWRVELGPLQLELSPGVYLTKRSVREGDSLVTPTPIYTLPVGDLNWEMAGGLSVGRGMGQFVSPPKKPARPGGWILGRMFFPDSVPAPGVAELSELGLKATADSTGRFVLSGLPADTYTLYISGKGISSTEPLRVVVMEEETTRVSLLVQRAEAGRVTVTIRDFLSKKTLKGLVMVEGISDDRGGVPRTLASKSKITFPLAAGAYVLTAKSDGYFARSTSLTLAEGQDVHLVMDLIPKGFTMEFPGVLFEFGSARIKPSAFGVLDSIAGVIRQAFASNPNLKIEVGGHTDNVGSDMANLRLSEQRARAVADYLVQNHGIDPDKVLFKGYGPRHPKVPNTTDEGRAKNRRVEIKLLEMI